MKERETRPHAKRIRTMALSIFLAVIVWIMVMSLTNPNITTTVSNLNVRFVGEQTLRDKGLAITGRGAIPTLSVKVRGSRSDLMSYMDDIYVQVDVSSVTAAGEYELSGTISVPTTRLTVEKENYGDIPITVEELVTKDIEVSVKQTGMQRNKLVSSVINNPTVKLSGARNEMERVYGAVATVDISRIREESRERVGYVLTDEAGSLISGNETIESARAEVEVTSVVYDAKTLPVTAELNEEMGKIYTLNTEKTVISPSYVTVGVKAFNNDESVKVIIDRPADETEQDYLLKAGEGMYIPPESASVSVKPELESKNPTAGAEENEDDR